MANGGIHIRRRGKLYAEPQTDLEIAASEVTSTIIDTYGITPAKQGEVTRFTAPDGQLYIIPKEIETYLIETTDRIAPSGIAKSLRSTSFKSLMEGNRYRDKMQQQMSVVSTVIENMVNDLVPDKGPPRFSSITTKDQARQIVEQYILETHPEYPELKNKLEFELGQSDSIGLEATESVKDMVEGLDEVFEQAQKRGLKDAVNKGLFTRRPKVYRRGVVDPEVEAYLSKTRMAEVLHSSNSIAAMDEGGLGNAINEKFENQKGLVEGFVSQYLGAHLLGFIENLSYKFKTSGVKGAVVGGATGVLSIPLGMMRFYNTLKKQTVTVGSLIFPNPAYYINNALGAIAQAYISGGITGLSSLGGTVARNPKVYFDTIRYLHRGPGGFNRARQSDGIMVTKDGRIFTARSLANNADRYGIGAAFIKAEMARTIAEDIRSNNPGVYMQFVKTLVAKDALSTFWMEMAQTTDNFFRVSKFLDEIHNGNSPAVAAQLTRDAFYDYAALTPTEKEVFRELFLFYAYMRKNQIQVMRALVDNPGRVLGQLRMIRNSQRTALEDEEGKGIDPAILREWLQFRYFVSGHAMPFDSTRQELDYKDIYGRRIQIAPLMGATDFLPLFIMLDFFTQEFPSPYDNVESASRFMEIYNWTTGIASPVPKSIMELQTGESLFTGMDLSKLRIDKAMVDNINNIMEGFGQKKMFATTDAEDGYINLMYDPKDYTDISKIKDQYYVAKEADVLKLYLFLEFVQSAPLTSPFYGRGRKFYGEFAGPLAASALPEGEILGIQTGQPFRLTLGETIGERAATGASFPSYNLKTEEQQKRRLLYERLQIIAKEQKQD